MPKKKGRPKRKPYRQLKGPLKDLYEENKFKVISVEPKYWDSSRQDVAEFAVKYLQGYLWFIRYDPSAIAHHGERREVETVLHRLNFWLSRGERSNEWWPEEEEQLELALVDFVRLLPKLWD